MSKKTYLSEEDQWKNLIYEEKRKISAIENNPTQVLMKIFELCIDNFDNNDLANKQPVLYKNLLNLYDSNNKVPILEALNENISSITQIVHIFNSNKEEIRYTDIQLFYALLYFIDTLKTQKAKRIYYEIC